METGWLKLHRKFKEWEWYQDSKMVHLFIHLLVTANHQDNTWKGALIKRGQMITGLHKLNQQTKIPVQSLRTCIKRLKSTGEITIKSTNQYSLITLCNYESYQIIETVTNKQSNKPTNKPPTSNQQTGNKPANNKQEEYKNNKNVKNDKNIEERKNKFCLSLHEFNDKYSDDMLFKFEEFWTEPNPSKTKMRFELEKTWDLERRLARWARKEKEFSKDNKPKSPFDELREQNLKTNENT